MACSGPARRVAASVSVGAGDGGTDQRKRCVSCDKLQPADGKLLHCLHVICLSCLHECIRDADNSLQCMLCGAVTTSKRCGAHLSLQLVDCRPLLYASRQNGGEAATIGGESRLTEARMFCALCSDSGTESVATHMCEDCDGEAMCDRHMERHTKRRVFATHKISPLTSGGSGASASVDAQRRGAIPKCVVHRNHRLVKYCETCGYCVCERCLVSGHCEHDVSDIQTAVEKQRAELRKLQGSSPLPISERISLLPAEMEKVKTSASEASRKATDMFKKAKDLVERAEAKALREIDASAWMLLEPLEDEQLRLQRIQDKERTAAELLGTLLDPESASNLEVLTVFQPVTSSLASLAARAESESPVPLGASVAVLLETLSYLSALERQLNALVTVPAPGLDLTASEIDIPDRLPRHEEAIIQFRPKNAAKQALPAEHVAKAMKCTLVSPNGEKSEVFPACPEGAVPNNSLRISVKPTQTGRYRLELRYGDSLRFVEFQCSIVELDPRKCSQKIVLTNNNLTATRGTSPNSDCCVLALEGYTHGVHQWSVKSTVCRVPPSTAHIAAGVCVEAADNNYSYWYFPSPCYFWKDIGKAYPSCAGSDCPPWANGDRLEFTLDCDNKTLELYHHRTGHRKVIRGLNCSQPLYPAIYLYTPGYQAEIVDT